MMNRYFVLFLLVSASSALAQSDSKSPEWQVLKGKIKKVLDGDSVIVVDEEKTEHETQLEGIDAPEVKQEYGKEATKELEKLLENKEVRVEWQSKDNYKRILGKVYVEDKQVNLEMVKLGAAWHFKRYNKEEVLAKAEEKAKDAKLGLWKADTVEAPWDFRRKNKTRD